MRSYLRTKRERRCAIGNLDSRDSHRRKVRIVIAVDNAKKFAILQGLDARLRDTKSFRDRRAKLEKFNFREGEREMVYTMVNVVTVECDKPNCGNIANVPCESGMNESDIDNAVNAALLVKGWGQSTLTIGGSKVSDLRLCAKCAVKEANRFLTKEEKTAKVAERKKLVLDRRTYKATMRDTKPKIAAAKAAVSLTQASNDPKKIEKAEKALNDYTEKYNTAKTNFDLLKS